MKRSFQGYEVKKDFSVKRKLKVTIEHCSLKSACEGSVDEVLRFVCKFQIWVKVKPELKPASCKVPLISRFQMMASKERAITREIFV